MKRLALAAASLLACQTMAMADPGPDQLTLACTGAFARDSDLKRVISVFGKKNVTQEKIDGAEGETLPGTVIFAGDDKRRIEIFWFDDKKHSRPSTVRIAGEGNIWSLGQIHAGSPVADVNAANGKAFKISGFDWDYGGLVQDWNGGKVPALAGGDCTVQMGFSHEGELPQSLEGDGVTVTSSDKALAKGKTTVSSLGIGWPEQ